MGLELAVVRSRTAEDCLVRLLASGIETTAVYSKPLMAHQIEVLSGDLVAVDRAARPPVVVFRWGLTEVQRVGGERLHTDRECGGQPLTRAKGFETTVAVGDAVYAALGEAYDVCVDGTPAHPERLRADHLPQIELRFGLAHIAPTRGHVSGRAGRGGAGRNAEYLTAETERGRAALSTVIQSSYAADCASVPARWARARVVDGVPVSFIVVDPSRQMDFDGGDVGYAFVNDVATRYDRRGEGHFRAIVEHVFSSLRESGVSCIVLHGRYQLYRRFGFEVFTHHCGAFITPEQIERRLGTVDRADAAEMLTIEQHAAIHDDLLLVTGLKAQTPEACRAALLAAAAEALARGKARILFEHPGTSCGERYPIHRSVGSPLLGLARACGAEVRVQGADPESSSVPDADWIKVLDATLFVDRVVSSVARTAWPLPDATVGFDTDAGQVLVESRAGTVTVSGELDPGATTLAWPSSALAQLATGYVSAEALCAMHGTPLAPPALGLLQRLFPRAWRFSRNESWVYKS